MEYLGFYLMVSRMIKAAGKCQVERIVVAPKKADLEKAREALRSADAIFMSGGDVEEGMEVLRQKNLVGLFQNLYQEGGCFFGALPALLCWPANGSVGETLIMIHRAGTFPLPGHCSGDLRYSC